MTDQTEPWIAKAREDFKADRVLFDAGLTDPACFHAQQATEWIISTKEMRAMRYAIIIERSQEEYFAFVPGLPGCTSSGNTQGEALENIRDAILLTHEYMKENGISFPDVVQMVAEVEA